MLLGHFLITPLIKSIDFRTLAPLLIVPFSLLLYQNWEHTVHQTGDRTKPCVRCSEAGNKGDSLCIACHREVKDTVD